MTEEVFSIPTGPMGPWDQLSTNEKAWIELIRVISCGSDPRVTLPRVDALREMLENQETNPSSNRA